MKGENEREADLARLHALIERALASGKLPKHLMEVSRKDVEALDADRFTRLKKLVKSGDLNAIAEAMEARTPVAGFNRGDQAEPKDEGLDAARERVKDRLKRERRGPESPETPPDAR